MKPGNENQLTVKVSDTKRCWLFTLSATDKLWPEALVVLGRPGFAPALHVQSTAE